MPRKKADPNLRANLSRMLKIHFLYIFALAIQIIVFDAGMLIEPVVVFRRWILVLSSLVVFTFLWYLMQKNNVSQGILRRVVLSLILVDVTIASFYVYTQRGMASKAVFLYIMPLLVAACMQRKKALLSAGVLCVAAYLISVIAYFNLNFNEGYKIELYGEAGFYSAMLLLIALALWILVRPRKNS
jgi:hypothetical protein